jgi:serine/threonine-protein kinase
VDGELGSLQSALPSYEIGAVLGRGSWGTVVAAHHRALNRAVAIKWLRPELVDDAGARSRFNAEAQVLAALDHPHVVRVYDYVEVDDVCALVMERLPGGTIADRTRLGPLPAQSACAYALAALHGLEHAHHHDVLHRDVKPENLMLAADGRLRVTDFGIAAIVGGNAQRLTQTGMALGTPAYMAPEQLADPDRIGTYTDVWSASAVLYELLTHQVPYEARSTLHATLMARATEEPRPVRDVTPDLPQKLADAVMQGLAREIEDRYPTCLEAADAIDAAAVDAWGGDWLARTGIPLQRTPPRPRAAPTSAVPLPSKPPAPAPAPRRRSRRKIGWVTAAAAAIAGGVVAAVTLTGGGNPTHATEPNGSDSSAAPAPGGLPAVPAGWGDHLSAGVAVPDYTQVAAFGRDTLVSYTFAGDPVSGTDFRSLGGTAPAADVVRDIESAGGTPFLSTYMLRTTGHPGDDQSGEDALAILNSPKLMKPYWESTIELLDELGSLDAPIPLVVDVSVAATVQSTAGNDPRTVPAAVAGSGVSELRGIPDTFAGWAQAWVKLRDQLAPKVLLGWSVESYGVGDYLIPNRPSDPTLDQYAHALRGFYGRLGATYDFIDYTVAYGDGARLGAKYMARAADITVLQHWVKDMTAATDARVVLDAIPAGNTLMRAMNNTDYHWQDRYAQLLVGGGDETSGPLTRLRDAGAIGLIFGPGYAAPDFTCPCDAAGDGETNPPASGTATGKSLSADDDGGYLAQQLTDYASGRLPL